MARWTGGRRQAGREGGGDLGCRAVDGLLVQRLGPCAMVTGAGTEIPEAFTARPRDKFHDLSEPQFTQTGAWTEGLVERAAKLGAHPWGALRTGPHTQLSALDMFRPGPELGLGDTVPSEEMLGLPLGAQSPLGKVASPDPGPLAMDMEGAPWEREGGERRGGR